MAEDINKSNLLVSVITVVFNGEAHLEQTIRSVLAQTYKNVEYIIIDGGSTDGTVDIIRKYEDQISYWISEKDNGIYDAMNKGILQASGELIGILNADDWYEEFTVESIVNAFKNKPGGGVYYGLLRIWANKQVHSIQGNTHLLLDTKMIAHPTSFVKKELYETYGAFDTNYKIVGDYEFMLKLRSKGVHFVFIEKILTNFRLGGVSNVSDRLRIFEKLQIQYKYNIIGYCTYLLKKIVVLLTSIV